MLNEESLRKNFTLIYELVDEILDFGWPQSASTAELQSFVFNTPAPVAAAKDARPAGLGSLKAAPRTMSSKAVHKPISLRDSGTGKNEIFVDVIDRISATFNSNGQVRTFTVDGSIQMKSYLAGSPQLHLALNDQLVISGGQGAGYGAVELDNVNFHECVDLSQFEQTRMLVLEPPHGEFVLMNFHIGSLRHEGQIPFRVMPMLSAISEYKQELRLQIRADFPEKFHGANVKVTFTVPKSSTGASVELAAGAKQQNWEYDDATKTVTWLIRKFPGGSVQAVSCKFVVKSSVNVHKEMGPVSLAFEIPMYNSRSCRSSTSRSSSATSRTTRTGGCAASPAESYIAASARVERARGGRDAPPPPSVKPCRAATGQSTRQLRIHDQVPPHRSLGWASFVRGWVPVVTLARTVTVTRSVRRARVVPASRVLNEHSPAI